MEITLQDLPLVTLLDRIRKAIIRSLLAVLVLSVVGWFLTDRTIALIMGMYDGIDELVYVNVAENFLTRLKLASILGFTLSMPWILWQVRSVVAPMIHETERRLSVVLIGLASILFYFGLFFAVYGVLPFALRFFLGFGGEEVEAMIRFESMISFSTSFAIPFALVFQLPVVLYFLGRLGLLTAASLRRFRKYSILVIFIVAAALTPADVFSQFMMAIPLMVLYEVSIFLVKFAERARTRQGSAN